MMHLGPGRGKVTLVAALMLTGCGRGGAPGELDAPEMHRRFSRTLDVQTGVVFGDLAQARTAAAWLATRQEEGLPPRLSRYQENIRDEATRISRAEDLEAVALGMGKIAAACGGCHVASSGGPAFVVGERPSPPGSTGRRMILHLWAADRLWEGLVGPSDEAWMAGAEALAEVRRSAGSEFLGTGSREPSPTVEAQFGRAVEEALEAATPDARSAAYGTLLATCNACHQRH